MTELRRVFHIQFYCKIFTQPVLHLSKLYKFTGQILAVRHTKGNFFAKDKFSKWFFFRLEISGMPFFQTYLSPNRLIILQTTYLESFISQGQFCVFQKSSTKCDFYGHISVPRVKEYRLQSKIFLLPLVWIKQQVENKSYHQNRHSDFGQNGKSNQQFYS